MAHTPLTAPELTPFPGVVPLRTQPQSEFSTNTGDLLTWWAEDAVPDMNAVVAFINGDFNLAIEEINALAQSTNNLASTVVSASNFKGAYSELAGALDVPSTVEHLGTKWQLLVDLADVTTSVPSAVNSDWTFASQSSDRAVIISPFTLVQPGRYLIIGSGVVTITDPGDLSDGQSWDFASESDEAPTVEVLPGTNVFKFPNGALDDGVVMNSVTKLELLVRSGIYIV